MLIPSNSRRADVPTAGWTSSPNVRGTTDILFSCFLTIFLCCWVTLCVNVPPPGSGFWDRLKRKILVFFETLSGPEFIFHTSLSQYLTAKKSVKEFEKVGFKNWTIKHGFFCCAGGFRLNPPDFVSFPLNMDQIHYLVCHGYIDYDKVHLDLEDIEDRNKFDSLSRIITSVQLTWFLVNVIARSVAGLSVTTLELSTCGFIFCTLGSYLAWRHKPQDVTRSVELVLKNNKTMADILTEAGPIAALPYEYTPMDFARSEPHWFGVLWGHFMNRMMPKFLGIRLHPRTRPVDKIWDDEFGKLPPKYNALLAFVQFGFATIHMAAWNSHFPTKVEQFLWRLSTLYVLSAVMATWIVLSVTFEVWPRVKQRFEGKNPEKQRRKKGRWRTIAPLPTRTSYPAIPIALIYFAARSYILVEDIVNLRSLPQSTYVTVDWNTFLPHFS
ncbi:MAG: hypothetical protein GOMPHAMPRED_005907 [Gomphillus americanus]|uniref:Uncharacterized protein n=1 Tax=Gomphillus americanus TaxID=1940652 RepID=A0A8H3G1G1_9LECA|nr:MAG: hypothetical protein GOMPHAMPRED_005907 [Gomphillus americanus]